MNAAQLLEHLEGLGVRIWTEGGELKLRAPEGVLTPELRDTLRQRKAELMAALSEGGARGGQPEPAAAGAIGRVPREGNLPPSFSQQRLWFIQQLEPDLFAYNIALNWRLGGDLNLRALEQSLTELVRRHEVLRTNFVETDGIPSVVIAEPPDIHLEVVRNQGELREQEWRKHIVQTMSAAAERPFDLEHEPLYRFEVFSLNDREHELFVVVHHAIFDGASIGIFLRDTIALYEAHSRGIAPSLPELPVQYADYAAWQREIAEGEPFGEQLAYWLETLGGELPVLELPTDRRRPAVQTYAGSKQEIAIPEGVIDSLTQLAKREGATLYMTLLAAYYVLLMRHTGQKDLAVGTAINGRNQAELEGLIGFFVNTLVLRTDTSGDPSFRELLRRVRDVCFGAFGRSEVPFERLVDELAPERDLAYSPIFQTMFLQEHGGGVQDSHAMGDLTILPPQKEDSLAFQIARTDLTFWMASSAGEFIAWAEYNTDLFDGARIVRMLGHFRTLLDEVAADPDRPISELRMLTQAERQDLLVDWNATAASYPELPIQAQFEAQADRTPDATAVIFPADGVRAEVPLSYCELDRRANRLAQHLIAAGVQPGGLVGVCLERSAELPVSLLGILKTGSAYVPLDPTYPQDRIAYMADDAGLEVVVTTGDLSHLLPSGPKHVCIDAEREAIAARPDTRPGASVGIDDRMYVIYTSGSTGRPKGVELEHRSASNMFASINEQPGFSAGERFLAVTTPSFDISVYELFGPLLVGGTVIVAPQEAVSAGDRMRALLERYRPDVLQATPALWRMLILSGWTGDPNLRIHCTGEAFARELAQELVPRGKEVWNLYGPTEATIWATIERVESGDKPVLIGRPVASTRIYILDEHMQPLPIGVPGELYIGGACLARGYLGRPDLTRERFLPDPFVTGERIYRSGDLARFLPNGDIECLGRIDNQVKLRGFRIELGEIESVLAEVEGVRQCVCVVREDRPGDQRLTAYYVSAGDVQVAALRQGAASKLPAFMIPASFVELESLPLTPNGKVDRGALLALGTVQPTVETEFVAPSNDVERGIAAIWQEVLGAERVGVNDNFFELGGNSLLTLQAMVRIRRQFEVELPLRDIFELPTVSGLARKVGAAARQSDQAIVPVSRLSHLSHGGDLPLSFTQQRLWFLEQLEPGLTAYNMWLVCTLRGRLDVPLLERSLSEIVRRHEVLRTSFPDGSGGSGDSGSPVQRVAEARAVELEVLPTLSRAEVKQHIEERMVQPFDLARGPLIRPTVARVAEDEHVLFVLMHHIVFDGWSSGIFFRELAAIYDAFSKARPSPLPELPIQYADFSVWQRGYFEQERTEHLLRYWREVLAGELPMLELPLDRPRPAVQTYEGAGEVLSLPAEMSHSLAELGRRQGATLFMVMVAAYKVLLLRYTKQEDLIVGTPIANRNRQEVEGLIGFFANTLVLRTDMSGDPSFLEVLERVRDACLGAYEHQDMSFERLVDEIQPERDLSYTPLFQTMFVLDEDSGEDFEMGSVVLEPFELDSYVARTDLSLFCFRGRSALRLFAEYNTDLFDRDSMVRLLEHYSNLLQDIMARPDRRVSELALLGAGERHQVLEEWNATAAAYPEQAIHSQFEAQVERTPDRTALIFPIDAGPDVELSYRELDARANRLARHLVANGVQPGSLVGVCLERSAELVVSLLGIQKAGAAYVPLDPTFPQGRIAYMVEDAGLELVVTTSALAKLVPTKSVCLDSQAETIASCSDAPTGIDVSIGDRMYVIYTSGSTGRPKGVELEHRSVSNLLTSIAREPGFAAGERLLAVTTPSFDISVYELFGPLVVGGTVIVAPQPAVGDGDRMKSLLERYRPDVLDATPAMWRMLVLSGWEGDENLRIFCTGEAFPRELAPELLPRGKQVWNLYGPTEATVWAAIDRVEPGDGPILIGRPIASTRLYILDAYLQPVPIGVAGELYIGGDGLARGYLGRPELTQERFLPDPFVPGARIYRTGDLARHLANGDIECLGRIDNQVKLRGYRIELGEIETVLAEADGVQQCACVVREDQPGDQRLVAYFVSERDVDLSELRRVGSEKLPAYMIPSSFVELESFPLTPNGKVNRLALLDLESLQPTTETQYVAPRNEVEQGIADIWKDVLGAERVGMNDNFFELGGNSLLTTQVMARVRRTFEVDVPLRKLFEGATVAELALQVRGRSDKFSDRLYEATFRGSLVPMQPNGTRTPLFLVSGAHAEEEEFLRFVGNVLPHLLDQPIYGFKSRGLDGLQPPHDSTREMATDYIKEMREVQPEGPYLLAGECVGGIVAFEMAQQLREQGHEVGLVALLDSARPTDEYFEFLTRYLGHARRQRGRERLKNHLKKLLAMSLPEQIRYASSKIRSKLSKTVPLTKEQRRLKRGRSVEDYYLATNYSYRPRPYHGKLTLVYSKAYLEAWKDAGWKEIAVGGLEIREVPGDHVSRWTIYSKENAAVLRSCLDDAVKEARKRPAKHTTKAKAKSRAVAQ